MALSQTPPTSAEEGSEATMITKETLRKMCEYPYGPSLVGEAIVDYEVDFVVRETAEQRARRIWGMDERNEDETQNN
jgi:hypothetical protein